MVRIQVQVEASQHRQIRQRARLLGISMSEVIRRCVDRELTADPADEHDERIRRALAVAGKYTDPGSKRSVAAHHDAALAEAFRQ